MNTRYVIRHNWRSTHTNHPDGRTDHLYEVTVGAGVRLQDHDGLSRELLESAHPIDEIENTAERHIIHRLYGSVIEDAQMLRHHIGILLHSAAYAVPPSTNEAINEILDRLERAGKEAE